MNKKKYLQPEMSVFNMKVETLLMASVDSGTNGARERSDIGWDDEDFE